MKAASVQLESGSAAADPGSRLEGIREQVPQLAPAIRRVEEAREQIRHDERWKEVYAGALSLTAIDEPEQPLSQLDAFLREFPDTTHRTEVLALARTLKNEVASRHAAVDRKLVDDLIRSELLPGASLTGLIEKARQFLADHPESILRNEVQGRLDGYLQKLDERDIEPGAGLLTPLPDQLRDADRTVPGLPEKPPGRGPVPQRGYRGKGSDPPRVGSVRLPPGLRSFSGSP